MSSITFTYALTLFQKVGTALLIEPAENCPFAHLKISSYLQCYFHHLLLQLNLECFDNPVPAYQGR